MVQIKIHITVNLIDLLNKIEIQYVSGIICLFSKTQITSSQLAVTCKE